MSSHFLLDSAIGFSCAKKSITSVLFLSPSLTYNTKPLMSQDGLLWCGPKGPKVSLSRGCDMLGRAGVKAIAPSLGSFKNKSFGARSIILVSFGLNYCNYFLLW